MVIKWMQSFISVFFQRLVQSGPFGALIISLGPVLYVLVFEYFELWQLPGILLFMYVVPMYAITMGFSLLLKGDYGPASRVSLAGFLIVVSLPFAFGSMYETLSQTNQCIEGASGIKEHLYFSYVAFTTVGFGDLQPVGVCRAVAVIEAVIGYVFLGLLVGASSQLFSQQGFLSQKSTKGKH